MIKFIFTGNPYPSIEEQEISKSMFIEKLGLLKDEFENSGGCVTFDYSYPPESEKRISYVLDNQHSLSAFTRKWNEYITGNL